MKRDLDLIRSMLLRIEEFPSSNSKITCSSFLDLCDNLPIISLHIELLADAGYIQLADMIQTRSYKDFLIDRITFDGYDYLDAVRSASIWEKTKSELSKAGGSAAIDVVKSIATSLIKAQLGV